MKMTEGQLLERVASATWTAGCVGNMCREPWDRIPEWAKVAQLAEAAWVIAEQDRRERPLVEFIRNTPCYCHEQTDNTCPRCRVLRAYAALDAAPEPTLLEAAKKLTANVTDGVRYRINGSDLVALKSAVEREEAKR